MLLCVYLPTEHYTAFSCTEVAWEPLDLLSFNIAGPTFCFVCFSSHEDPHFQLFTLWTLVFLVLWVAFPLLGWPELAALLWSTTRFTLVVAYNKEL